jgi:DNA modification methylase
MIEMPLVIDHQKVCKCTGKNRLNCLNGTEWGKNMVNVWKVSYEKRDIRDRNKHPATYPIALAARAITVFTHKGELVVDPFSGSGTTVVAAQDYERSAVGFDLQQKYCDLARSRLQPANMWHPNLRHLFVQADARDIPQHLMPGTVKFIMTSPPYADMLQVKSANNSRHCAERKQKGASAQYSQDEKDLGTLNPENWEKAIAEIFGGMLPLLTSDGNVLINVADPYVNGKRLLLHVHVIKALQGVGYEFRNMIFWDRSNIINGIGVFGYPTTYMTLGAGEYLLHFRPNRT